MALLDWVVGGGNWRLDLGQGGEVFEGFVLYSTCNTSLMHYLDLRKAEYKNQDVPDLNFPFINSTNPRESKTRL